MFPGDSPVWSGSPWHGRNAAWERSHTCPSAQNPAGLPCPPGDSERGPQATQRGAGPWCRPPPPLFWNTAATPRLCMTASFRPVLKNHRRRPSPLPESHLSGGHISYPPSLLLLGPCDPHAALVSPPAQPRLPEARASCACGCFPLAPQRPARCLEPRRTPHEGLPGGESPGAAATFRSLEAGAEGAPEASRARNRSVRGGGGAGSEEAAGKAGAARLPPWQPPRAQGVPADPGWDRGTRKKQSAAFNAGRGVGLCRGP